MNIHYRSHQPYTHHQYSLARLPHRTLCSLDQTSIHANRSHHQKTSEIYRYF
jgi:hypothetical protein